MCSSSTARRSTGFTDTVGALRASRYAARRCEDSGRGTCSVPEQPVNANRDQRSQMSPWGGAPDPLNPAVNRPLRVRVPLGPNYPRREQTAVRFCEALAEPEASHAAAAELPHQAIAGDLRRARRVADGDRPRQREQLAEGLHAVGPLRTGRLVLRLRRSIRRSCHGDAPSRGAGGTRRREEKAFTSNTSAARLRSYPT